MNIFSNLGILAQVLGTKQSSLCYVAYVVPPAKKYRHFQIIKSNGQKRDIASPEKRFKNLQIKIAKLLVGEYEAKACVYSYVKGKSIVQNANVHCGQRFVINVDLRDFFHSIHFGRVKGVLLGHPYYSSDEVATTLAQLICYKNKLPQGAPTSPIMSNLVCRSLDNSLNKIARKYKAKYSRYSDDITISTSTSKLPSALAYKDPETGSFQIGNELLREITRNGFKVNHSKFRVQNQSEHQEVTGLTVNSRNPNVSRDYIRSIRAMINKVDKHGSLYVLNEYREFYRRKSKKELPPNVTAYDIIRGKLEFLREVKGASDPVYANYALRFQKIYPNYRSSENSKFNAIYFRAKLQHELNTGNVIFMPKHNTNINFGRQNNVNQDGNQININNQSFEPKTNETLESLQNELNIINEALESYEASNSELHEATQEVIIGVFRRLDSLNDDLTEYVMQVDEGRKDIADILDDLWVKSVKDEFKTPLQKIVGEHAPPVLRSLMLSALSPSK